jgi:hypothetical protein
MKKDPPSFFVPPLLNSICPPRVRHQPVLLVPVLENTKDSVNGVIAIVLAVLITELVLLLHHALNKCLKVVWTLRCLDEVDDLPNDPVGIATGVTEVLLKCLNNIITIEGDHGIEQLCKILGISHLGRKRE